MAASRDSDDLPARAASRPLRAFRARKHYSRRSVFRVRSDVVLRFAAPPHTVTLPEPVMEDCVDRPQGYTAAPVAVVELRNGKVVRDGMFVFTERDEVLRESVDRLAYFDRLQASEPQLASYLSAAPAYEDGEPVGVLGSQRDGNYFHWWIDSLAKCWAMETSSIDVCSLVARDLRHRFQRESLCMLGLEARPLAVPVQRFPKLVFAQGLALGSAQRLSPAVAEFAQWCRQRAKLTPRKRSPYLFVSRASAVGRGVINEDEVLARLGPSFELVRLEDLSVQQQAELFSQARVVVAPHGAGLTNLLFCAAPTAVVELVHADSPPATYRQLAAFLGHPYVAIGCRPRARGAGREPRRDMLAPPSLVKDAVARLVSDARRAQS